MDVIASIDQGTQSTRFSLYDKEKQCICSSSASLKQIVPHVGWCEQRPQDIMDQIYGLFKSCMAKAIKKLGKIHVVGLGIANQRETVVVWDKVTGAPLYNAIVWRDTRTEGVINYLIKEWGGVNAYKFITGLPLNNFISAVKIKWLMMNVEGLSEKLRNGTAIVGTIDTWIVWNLTGGGGLQARKIEDIDENCGSVCHITDVTNAARTYLMDINSCQWSALLLNKFGIPFECLPTICSSSEIYGYINNKRLGPSIQNVTIAGIVGDQQAACVGHGIFSVGQAKCTYGTGAFIFMNTGENKIVTEDSLFCTPCYKLGKEQPVIFALEAAIKTSGAGVTHLIDSMKIIEHPKDTNNLFREVKNHDNGKSNDVIYVPNISGSFAGEHENWYVRKGTTGFDFFHDRAYVVKALFEAICFQLHELLEKMLCFLTLQNVSSMFVDGGMTENEEFLQFTSNVINFSIRRPPNREVTSIGAAVLAGLGCGFWKNVEEVEMLISRESHTVFYPENFILEDTNSISDDVEVKNDYLQVEKDESSLSLLKKLNSFVIRKERLAWWKNIVFKNNNGDWIPYGMYCGIQRIIPQEHMLIKLDKNFRDDNCKIDGKNTVADGCTKNGEEGYNEGTELLFNERNNALII